MVITLEILAKSLKTNLHGCLLLDHFNRMNIALSVRGVTCVPEVSTRLQALLLAQDDQVISRPKILKDVKTRFGVAIGPPGSGKTYAA